jgi:hypothetical protein
MKPFDVVRLNLEEHVGNCGQPENWTLASLDSGRPHVLISDWQEDPWIIGLIHKIANDHCSSGLIFGDSTSSIAHLSLQIQPIEFSLCLVRPDYLRWQRDVNYRGIPCVNGYFDLARGKVRHRLRLTDVEWEKRLINYTETEAIIEHEDIPEVKSSSETFLTISLGDLFQKTGCHYKLIAGVINLPA